MWALTRLFEEEGADQERALQVSMSTGSQKNSLNAGVTWAHFVGWGADVPLPSGQLEGVGPLLPAHRLEGH